MILYIIRTNAIFDFRLKICARIIYEVWLLNNRTDFLKHFVRYQLHSGLYIAPDVSSQQFLYSSIRIFYCANQCWKCSCVEKFHSFGLYTFKFCSFELRNSILGNFKVLYQANTTDVLTLLYHILRRKPSQTKRNGLTHRPEENFHKSAFRPLACS